jgi:peptidoglycan hydrolase CwlO-like protein
MCPGLSRVRRDDQHSSLMALPMSSLVELRRCWLRCCTTKIIMIVVTMGSLQGCFLPTSTEDCRNKAGMEARHECFDQVVFPDMVRGAAIGAGVGAVAGAIVVGVVNRHVPALVTGVVEGATLGGVGGAAYAHYIDSSNEIRRLTNVTEDLERDLQEFQQRISDLERRLEIAHASIADANQTIATLQDENQNVEELLKWIQKDRDALNSQIKDLRTKLSADQEQITIRERARARLDYLYDDAKQTIAGLKQRIDDYRRQRIDLQNPAGQAAS